MASDLIYPEHPLFLPILQSTPPPGWRDSSKNSNIFVISADGSGMMRQVNEGELAAYMHGGEYEEIEGEEIIDVDFEY